MLVRGGVRGVLAVVPYTADVTYGLINCLRRCVLGSGELESRCRLARAQVSARRVIGRVARAVARARSTRGPSALIMLDIVRPFDMLMSLGRFSKVKRTV